MSTKHQFVCLCKLALVCSTLLLFTIPAFGFCTEPEPTVACEFLNSDAVFIGTVISTQDTPAQGSYYDGWTYEISVQKMYRGSVGKTIDVFTEKSSGQLPLDNGKEYVLFATEEEGRLMIYSCGNSALLSKAAKTVEELNRLRIPQDAEIEGQVIFRQDPLSQTPPHVSEAHVVIRGAAKTYTLTCDRNGRFHLHVPPGDYSADVEPIAHWNIEPSGISIDDPPHFEARKGHCSGLSFFADPR